MSVLKILQYPDQRLRLIAKPINKITKAIKNLAYNMLDTMYTNEGIGLAATQVNIQLQMIVVSKENLKKEHLILVNPRIVEQKGNISIQEGCLSIPEYRAFIPRSDYIKVKALNLFGKEIEIEANSIFSVCIQHEIDHLKGKLFIDYLSLLKKERIEKKINKINKKNKILEKDIK
ncbi:peptide deformylase [Buchnera aphidicola (Aphis craccivora)]|uniref:Peptide deformylase n=1 Tax=Buchnera aphidicola (Aphis craccivora) TaxID=466616 RepID=A0A4D6XNM7_9GAMM|nr:peptide deformylase [Buchnera aphidicola]QCI16717.1 peptide deformylase [Buchnera aphidicola (Aphis craccivora)]QLL40850.1 peptide deformylase [Buchnera aphidicola (Aphis craccivore)]WAI17692.1 MAG: peptide deformylase [Buchnera aphidicola (Aphis craccivora)]